MYKKIILISLLGTIAADYVCQKSQYSSRDTVCYSETCLNAIKEHVKEELLASSKYLYLAGKMDNYEVNKDGLAKFLYSGAAEERDHAIMMLDYLNSRGINDFKTELLSILNPQESLVKESYSEYLKDVLFTEIEVTDKIHQVINTCQFDHHGADTFIHPILEEQYSAIRQLEGYVAEYKNIEDLSDHKFAEYIIDQKILNGRI